MLNPINHPMGRAHNQQNMHCCKAEMEVQRQLVPQLRRTRQLGKIEPKNVASGTFT